MRKAKHSQSDPYLAILDFRNTPTQGFESSPVQCLMNRRTKTLLPIKESLLKPKIEETNIHKEFEHAKQRQAYYYNQGAKELSSLKEGDIVRIEPNKHEQAWKKGLVKQQINTSSYEVDIEEKTFRRNRRHLHKTNEDIENKQEQFNANTHEFDEDELFDHNQQQDNYISIEPINQQNYMGNNTTALTTRSGRQVKKPSTFDDFLCNYSQEITCVPWSIIIPLCPLRTTCKYYYSSELENINQNS